MSPQPVTEVEITREVDVCGPTGLLNRAAVGWSRRPLHRCNARGRWGRNKRWDYWCVTCDTHLLALTYADLDYLGLASVQVLDYATGERVEKAVLLPLAPGFRQPETVGGDDIVFDRLGLRVAILEEEGGTRLQARARRRGGPSLEADVFCALPPEHETLNVLVPWSDDRFQFTSKHNTRPAVGRVRVDGDERVFGPENDAYGCLDFGRGVWPFRTTWNWASGSGRQGGRVVGLQLGAQWTDGTGVTENGLCVDGRLSKLSEQVAFDYDRRDFSRPWRLRTTESDRVELTFTPFCATRQRTNLLLAGADANVCFGRFAGAVVPDDGARIEIDGLVGWAEEMIARW